MAAARWEPGCSMKNQRDSRARGDAGSGTVVESVSNDAAVVKNEERMTWT
jgi:hypothetical protein